MNMAFTAGCFFILQCIFFMDILVADPLIDVSPSEITLGTTSTLDINCTFSLNNHPDVAAFISLVLSRANSTGQNFEDLAAITEFSPNAVKVLTQETVSSTGIHSQTGESYLSLTWQYPTALQGGVYKCSAHGVDSIGYNVEMTNISAITVDEANFNDIFLKLQQLELNIQTIQSDKISMEQTIQTLQSDKISMEQNIQTLENDKSTMEQEIQTQRNTISQLQSDVTRLRLQINALAADFFLLGIYKSSSYCVSNYAFSNIRKSIDVCKSLGGQLAVVNDHNEFTAIKNFLKSRSSYGISGVYISGSDEKREGNWVLSDSDTPLPFTSWYSGRPFAYTLGPQNNCLLLGGSSWVMLDVHCYSDSPSDDSIRFMCEI